MTALWTLGDMAAAMGGALVASPTDPISGFSIDTRSLKTGDAFVALTGEANDGHAYVAEALKKGAAVAIVAQSKRAALPAEGRFLLVDEPLAALNRLAEASRRRSKARIVAVTGSVGKTGTKEALRLVLSPSGATHAALASFNNHIGVPLTLSAMPAETEYGVFEIGMNHAGEITPLTGLVRPHVAIVTTVEPVHLEYFRDVAAIAEAKAEIFLGLEQGGAALINRDNPHYALLAERARAQGARIVFFGAHEESEARLLDVKVSAEGSIVSASFFGERAIYKIGAPGRHIAQNSLAVLAAVSLLGADLALAALAYARLAPPKGRGERWHLRLPRGGTFTLIDESYNANPASMAAAIALLGAARPERGGRRIAILGDMLELGAQGEALHAGLAKPLKEARADLVMTAGALMETLRDCLPDNMRGPHGKNAAELEAAALVLPHPGDVIMVKGSNGSKVGAIVEAFKTRYPLAASGDGGEAEAN